MERKRVEGVELRAGAGPKGRVLATGIFKQLQGLVSQTGTVEIVGSCEFAFAEVDCLQSEDYVYWGHVEGEPGQMVTFRIKSSAALDCVDFG